MQLDGGGSGIMGSVIFILLIIALMVVTFLAAGNKKPKTIYLKPKGAKKEKAKDNKKGEKKDSDETEPEVEKQEQEEAPAPTPRPDEDAMRSELRSLRQTAVSLTVGEKEGASALIKEWLEDNPNKSDDGEEEAGEE
jgi:FtsZ-interacting cell division protein ZipA